jgi:hypothetical protein
MPAKDRLMTRKMPTAHEDEASEGTDECSVRPGESRTVIWPGQATGRVNGPFRRPRPQRRTALMMSSMVSGSSSPPRPAQPTYRSPAAVFWFPFQMTNEELGRFPGVRDFLTSLRSPLPPGRRLDYGQRIQGLLVSEFELAWL